MESKVMTSKSVLPQPPVTPAKEPSIFDESIVAKPLGLGPLDNVKLKNPNIELRGVNYVAGGGLRLQQMQARGYVVATREDAEAPGWIWTDGAFKQGDLILMKHDRRAVLGARKYNVLKALERGGQTASLGKGQELLKANISEVSAPREVKSKMTAFVPSQKEVDALVGTDEPKK